MKSDLPIYKSTYDLMLELSKIVKNMEKDYKILIGKKMLDVCMDCVLLIYKANSYRNEKRVEAIKNLVDNMIILKLLIRLSKDLKLISISQFARLIEINEEINKQAHGWINYSSK